MKKNFLFWTLLLICWQAFSLTGEEIMQKVEDEDRGNTMHALMGMDLIDKDGNKDIRKIETWVMKYDKEQDLSKVIMEFKAPASVKDTRFLQVENSGRDDDKWIYLPALGRVRRISSSQGGDSFMGSDFSYDDMETREVEEDEHKLLKEEKLDKYDCYIVESTPKKKEDSQYSKRISWISKEHLIPVKVEMYSKKTGKVQKLLTVKQNIEKINNIWTAFYSIMKDMESGHQTDLYVKQSSKGKYFIEYNKKVDPNRFSQRFLKTGK